MLVPVKFIGIYSDTQSINNRIAVDNALLNEEYVVELTYCTKHERLYDATEGRWISFLRGEVRLVQTIYPKGDDLHFREDVCDVCIRVCQRCFGWQLESPLPLHLFNQVQKNIVQRDVHTDGRITLWLQVSEADIPFLRDIARGLSTIEIVEER